MRILVTGGRSPATLDLVRQLHSSGHTIFVADTFRWAICRYSNAVYRSFVVASPRLEPGAFINDLVRICESEAIDMVIPTWEETLYLSRHKKHFPHETRVFCSSFDKTKRLHHKYLFAQTLKELGLPSLRTELITHPDQLNFDFPYALKASYSRASEHVAKVMPGAAPPLIEITPENPYVAQEWLEGDRFCTYSVAQNGILKAHATYPVGLAKADKYCVSFEAVHHPAIEDWVSHLVKEMNFTGQLAFDMIETPEGLYSIECNPRITSGVHLFARSDNLSAAFLNENIEIIRPKPGRRRQIFIGMLLMGWRGIRSFREFCRYFKILFTTKDVLMRLRDFKPTLAAPLVVFNYLRVCRKNRCSLPAAFTYDVDWNGELDILHD